MRKRILLGGKPMRSGVCVGLARPTPSRHRAKKHRPRLLIHFHGGLIANALVLDCGVNGCAANASDSCGVPCRSHRRLPKLSCDSGFPPLVRRRPHARDFLRAREKLDREVGASQNTYPSALDGPALLYENFCISKQRSLPRMQRWASVLTPFAVTANPGFITVSPGR